MAQTSSSMDGIGSPNGEHTALDISANSDELDAIDTPAVVDGSNQEPQIQKRLLRNLLASAKSKEDATLLIQQGADVELRGDGDSTILMEATTIPVIELLISRGARLEDIDSEGRTALRRTVELDNDQAKAIYLIENTDAEINSVDSDGRSVLMTAVWKSRTDVLDLLLARDDLIPNASDKKGRIALHHLAADKERTYGYQHNTEPVKQQTIDQEILNKLLVRDNLPNAKDNKYRTCLHWAAATGCSGVLELLLQSERFNIDEPESQSKTPLHLAAAEGRSECIEVLLRKKARVDAEDDSAWTPLHYACEAPDDDLDSVQHLLKNDAKVNQKTRHGTTPLHLAAGAGNLEIARTLLQQPRIKRNARDMFGNTALSRAANLHISHPRRKEIIKLFAPWQNFHTISPAAKHAAELWNATIVDFRTASLNTDAARRAATAGRERRANDVTQLGPTADRLAPVSMFNLLYAQNKSKTGPVQDVRPSGLGPGGFRWIHIPVNNIEWCQDLFTKYYVEEGTMDVNSFKALERSFNQQQGGDTPQSRYMSSTCQSVLRPWGNEDGGLTMGDKEGMIARSATFSEYRTDWPGVESEERQQHSPIMPDGPPRRASTFASTSSNEDKELQLSPVMSKESIASNLKGPLPNERKKAVAISDRTETFGSSGSSNNERDARNPPNSPLAIQTNSDDAFISDFYVFMPYLHFEVYEKHEEMEKYRKQFENDANSGRNLQLAHEKSVDGQTNEKDVALFRAHLASAEHPLHIRRTLDQSFYRHVDTTDRDSGQVIHRFQTDILKYGKDKSKILMVDQLWMWVIGEELIVTSFPVRWEQPKNDPLNLLEYVMSIIDIGHRDPVRSIYQLAMIITGRCYGAYDRHGIGSEDPHFLDMYEGWIGNAMEDEVKLFKFFVEDSENASQWLRDPHPLREAKRRWLKRQKKKKKKAQKEKTETSKATRETTFKVIHLDRGPEFKSAEETFVENLLDIGFETALLQEVKDIRDELGMVWLIFERQEQVRKSIEDVINSIIEQKGPAWGRLIKQKFARAFQDHSKTITQPRKDTERMQSQAEGVYDSVRDLLDLKQKHANAIEARYAREQTDGTSRQGKTLTVFTIVTTIFLPISFIAAVFAIDMKNLPGAPNRNSDGKQLLSFGYVAKWTFMPGLLFAAVCVVVGLCWEEIWYWVKEMYGKRKRKKNSSKDGRSSPSSAEKGHPKTPKRRPGPPLTTVESTARSVRIQESIKRSISRKRRPRDEESGPSESQSTGMNGKAE